MVAEKKTVNKYPPLWERSPKKFEGAHESAIQFHLWQWDEAGKPPSLSKFMADYLDGLPENLPPHIVLDIAKWAAAEWANWYAEKQVAEMA